jgi:hypothetical protein
MGMQLNSSRCVAEERDNNGWRCAVLPKAIASSRLSDSTPASGTEDFSAPGAAVGSVFKVYIYLGYASSGRVRDGREHHFASQVEGYRRSYGAGHASLPVALRKGHIVAEAKFESSFCFGYDMFAKGWRLLSHHTLDHLLLTREKPVHRP